MAVLLALTILVVILCFLGAVLAGPENQGLNDLLFFITVLAIGGMAGSALELLYPVILKALF